MRLPPTAPRWLPLILFLAACSPSEKKATFVEPTGPTLVQDRDLQASIQPEKDGLPSRFGLQDPTTPSTPKFAQDDTPLRTDEQELLLRSARNAVALESWAEGIALFESYLLQVPNDYGVRMEYAGLLVHEGQLSLAREAFEDVRVGRPEDLDLRRSLANVLIIGGEYWSAMEELEAILTEEPNDVTSAAMLVRVYAWVKDFERAQQIYDRYLRKLDPSNEQDQLLLAPVLLDMQRPSEALIYLERLHRRYPMEVEWVTNLVLCYLQTGDRDRAHRLVREMSELQVHHTQPRIQLVDQLLLVKNYKLAMQVNRQVLDVAPTDPIAQLMSARILLEAYDVSAARDALARLDSTLGNLRAFQLAQARYFALIGRWVDAQGIYQGLLIRHSDDYEVRLLMAVLRREKGDAEYSKADLRKIPMSSPLGPRARVELSNTLISQGRYEDAAAVCQSVLAERPNYLEGVLGLVRAHLKLKAYAQARATCQRYIDNHSNDPLAVAQVQLALAKTHLLSGNAVLATRTYREALESPMTHTPEAFYGLASARLKGGNRDGGEMALMSSTVLASGEDIRLRVELAKLSLGDYAWNRASGELRNVLQWQPDNAMALVLLGEAYNQKLKAGFVADPARAFTSVLARDPNNSRARLGLARAFVIRHEFAKAIAEYDILIAQDASYTYVKRERARTLYWNQEYAASFEAYDELLAGLPTGAYPVDVFGSTTPNAGLRAGMDFEAELEVSEGIRLEREVKMNMAWRPMIAKNALDKLIVIEPANLEARFDLAQLHHREGHTRMAAQLYEELISQVTGHKEAEIALQGANLVGRPKFVLDVSSEDRNGRSGLTLMHESSRIGNLIFPMGDAEDFFAVGLGQRTYDRVDTTALNANVLLVRGSKSMGERTAVHGSMEAPHYNVSQDAFDERLLFEVGIKHQTLNELGVDVALFADNVAENSVTIMNDLHRTGARMGVTKKHSRAIDYGASLMFADYSDGNARFEMNLFAAYEFSPAPQSLRILTKIDTLDFSKKNNDIGSATDILELDIPYFAPSGYSIFSTQMDWRHQFGEYWFTGSPEMWYGASSRLAVDNNGAGYTELGVQAGYDFSEWFGMKLDSRMLRSSEIDMTSNSLLFTIRWP
ncbi:MAG: tetratricopeptide repeat protein [bacterium]